MSEVQQQSTQEENKVVKMKGKDKVAASQAADTTQAVKMYAISEVAVNQLLNTIAELPGLTWKQTNPIISFIQQNVRPL